MSSESKQVGPAFAPICPICGRRLHDEESVVNYTYHGVVYVFCSRVCKEQFIQRAELYIVHLAHESEWFLGLPCPYDDDAQ